MPAPRSVLIDIHDRGLNPKVAHKAVDSSGRIKGGVASDAEPVMAKVKTVKPVKPTKKAEPKVETESEIQEVTTESAGSGEAADEAATNEGAGSVEHKSEEAVPSAAVTTRRSKRNAPSNT